MFNPMNPVYPRPYPNPENTNYNSGNTSTDKDGHNQQGQGREQQQNRNQQQVIARGRADAQQNIQQRAAVNQPAYNAYPAGRQVYNVQTPPPIRRTPSTYPINQYNQIQQNYRQIPKSQPQPQAQLPVKSGQRSNKVNIAQILKDFRNTMKAIATPKEVEEEVNKFLQVVEEQVRQPQPQVNLIQSNLKHAASLLDKYISETLNKDSKVVQNWLDALFLQRINYKYNEEEVNPSFLVQFSDNNKQQPQQQDQEENTLPTEENNNNYEVINNYEPIQQNEHEGELVQLEEVSQRQEEKQDDITSEPKSLEEEFTLAQEKISKRPNITIIPQDTRLKSLFLEGKKQAFASNPQQAMMYFKEAFSRAEEINDSETQSRICLEVGKIYDDNDFTVQALTSYNKSLQYTTDTNVKSMAHYSMAQIYDDANQLEPALNHYMTSISYAGKNDNIIGQSESLTKMANILSDKYDEYAFEYFDVAKKLVDQTNDDNMKGFVLSNTADACVQFRRKDKALKYYAEAVKHYEKTNDSEEIAENYKAAAELMINFNSPNKAKSLLKKALVNAVKTKNEDLISEVNMMLTKLSE